MRRMKHDQDSTLPKDYCQTIELLNPNDLEKGKAKLNFRLFRSSFCSFQFYQQIESDYLKLCKPRVFSSVSAISAIRPTSANLNLGELIFPTAFSTLPMTSINSPFAT